MEDRKLLNNEEIEKVSGGVIDDIGQIVEICSKDPSRKLRIYCPSDGYEFFFTAAELETYFGGSWAMPGHIECPKCRARGMKIELLN